MKYVFVVYNVYPYPLAYHLIEEGHDVIVAVAKDISELKIPGEISSETPEERKQQLSIYEGMVPKTSLPDLFKILDGAKDKDEYFFYFDYNDQYMLAERVLDMGFHQGMFPTELYYRLEKERSLGKEWIKKYNPRVKVPETVPETTGFKKVEEAKQFLGDGKRIYVLKSNGKHGKTIVPKTDDPKVAKDELLDRLQKFKKDYEHDGFVLERKIPDVKEVTPVMAFYDGVPIYSLVEFENKEFGAGNIGIQKGGNQVLTVRTELDAEINRIAFPEATHKMAARQRGWSIYDAGLLYDGQTFWFTEFCGMRHGWDGIIAEIGMRDQGREPFVSKYFEDVAAGRNPLRNKYGASVRIFNYNGSSEETNVPIDGIPVDVRPAVEKNIFLHSVKKDGKIVSVGGCDILGAASGAGDTPEHAAAAVYANVEGVYFANVYYRPRFDYMSMAYPTSIMNRLKAVEEWL